MAISEVKRSPQAANLDEMPEPVETSRLNDPESLVDLKFNVAAVREGLLGLPEHLREILILRFVSDLSHEEVGRQEGKTAQNVLVIQFRALKRQRGELEESGYPPSLNFSSRTPLTRASLGSCAHEDRASVAAGVFASALTRTLPPLWLARGLRGATSCRRVRYRQDWR